jgi:hypothetical protein
VRLSTTTLDVSDHRDTVGLRVHARDNAGVLDMRAWMFGDDNLFTTRTTWLRLRQGSRKDGQWQGRIVVPRLAGSETAHLIVEMWDIQGRHRKYLPRRLAEIGQPHEVLLRGHVDTERPELRTLELRPRFVDVREGKRKVTLQVRVTDRGGGVRTVNAWVYGSATGLDHQGYDVRLRRVRGTAHDGVWRAKIALPRCEAEAGRWKAYVVAFDYSLPGRGATTRPVTVTNDDIAPPEARVVGTTGATGPLTLRFDEDVVGVSTENVLVHLGSDVEDRPGGGPAPVAGTWACRDMAGSPVDCAGGPVRTAAFTPDTPFRVGAEHTVVLNPEHHLGLTDLAGNPPVDLFNWTLWLSNDLEFTPR